MPGRAHLIGIAGCGMQSLAGVLLQRGWQISGSDLSGEGAGWLRTAGVKIAAGHAAENLPDDADLVIYSGAVPDDVPERRLAAQRGIPQLSYAQALGALLAGKHGLAIAGTHGKSTTTAMAGAILAAAGLEPTVVVGASALDAAAGSRWGDGRVAVVEACEYRRNFLHLAPRGAAVLNIEADHFDCYADLFEVEAAFREFVERMPADGYLAIQADQASTRRLARDLPCCAETFGTTSGADWRAVEMTAERGHYAFRIERYGRTVCSVRLAVAGRHQVHNALAAAALSWSAGARGGDIQGGLARFRGLRRRLEIVAVRDGVTLIDDYAHHPTEIAAALGAVRERFPNRRLWCVFQPHQASRTGRLLDELAASLHNADVVAVAEVYHAREDAAGPRATAAELAARVTAGGRSVLPWHAASDLVEHAGSLLCPGDVLVTLGAGDIRKVCDGIADRLGRHRAAG